MKSKELSVVAIAFFFCHIKLPIRFDDESMCEFGRAIVLRFPRTRY